MITCLIIWRNHLTEHHYTPACVLRMTCCKSCNFKGAFYRPPWTLSEQMFRGGRQIFQVGQAPSGPTVIRPLKWPRLGEGVGHNKSDLGVSRFRYLALFILSHVLLPQYIAALGSMIANSISRLVLLLWSICCSRDAQSTTLFFADLK